MIKKRLKKSLILFPVSVGIFMAHNMTLAAQTTSSFTVTATVAASCTINATNLSFGNYTLAQVDATSTILVTCTNGTAYDVTLNAGTATGATDTTRKMTGPVYNSTQQYLPYYLYSNAGRTTNWGNTQANAQGTGGTGFQGTGTGAQQTLTVYGRIMAGLDAAIGSYTDTITVTIKY